MQSLGIIVRGLFDSGSVLIQARTVKAGLIQILRGSYKSPRFALHGGTKCAKAATRLWSQEEENLLGLGWHDNDDPFLPYLLVPCFSFCDPVIRWGIGRAAKEYCNQ